MTSFVVNVSKMKKKSPKAKEMFEWCAVFCSRDGGRDGRWGTSWWTANGNTEFHFIDEYDAMMFLLRFS